MKNLLRSTRRGWMLFNEADKGGQPGGSSSSDATPASEFPLNADSPVPEIVGATIEEQRTNALSALGKLFKQAQGLFAKVTSLTTDLASRTADLDRLQGLYDTATTENTRLTGEVTRLTSERDTANTALAAEKTNVKNLESHCGVLGIDAKEAIKAPKQSSETAGDKKPHTTEYMALKAKEDKGEVPHGTASKYLSRHKKEINAEKDNK